MNRKAYAVRRIEPIFISGFAPWLDVARFEQLRGFDAGDGAARLPKMFDVVGPARVVALPCQALDFCFVMGL